MNYIHFIDESQPNKKTKLFRVENKMFECLIGWVKFNPGWRKYIFIPAESTIFDAGCLRDIADFTESETKKWKDKIS